MMWVQSQLWVMPVAFARVGTLTPYAMQGDRERALAAGFDGYLTKPVNLKALLAEIQRRLP